MPPRPNLRAIPRPVEPPFDPEMPPPIHPGDEALHPFLRFTRAEDRESRDRLLGLARLHGYTTQRYVDWDSLRAVTLRGRAISLCGPHWTNLFSIRDPTCQELTIEFLSTIHMISPLLDYAREDALTFRLGGEERRLSLRQFAVLMGLYTEEELDTPAFTEGIVTWPEGISAHDVWRDIGTGRYTTPTLPKSTKIVHPLHRIIHRAIVHSLTSRGITSTSSVSQIDLFYLHCIIRSRPCQIAERLAHFLFTMRKPRDNQGIFGGGYVTRLAKAMAIIPDEETEDFTFAPAADRIDMPVLVKMGVAERLGNRYRLLDIAGHPWREDGAAEVHEHVAPVQQPPQIQLSHHEDPLPSPEHRSPTQSQRSEARFYQRRDPIQRLAAEIATLRERQEYALEMQRLEYAHAEACRDHSFRIQQLMHRGSTEPLPAPPLPPQRLRDFYDQVGTSGASSSHQQPPS